MRQSYSKTRETGKTETIEFYVDTTIQDLEQERMYKYVGVNEGDGIQHAKMKEKIRKEYFRRIRLVLKFELNAANRIDATPLLSQSSLIVPTS